MLEILKENLKQNFLTIFFGILLFFISAIAIISYATIKLAEKPEIRAMKQCSEICERNVESFTIDKKTQVPSCQCKPGLFRKALEKYLEE